MDSEQVTESVDKEISMEDHLDSLCEFYMTMGVPYEVFWHGDYCQLKYYERVYLRKRKIQNENMWMMGMYNYNAHSTTLANAFKDKGKPTSNYLEKPIEFFPKTEEEEKAEAEKIKAKIIANLNALKDEWEKRNVTGNC